MKSYIVINTKEWLYGKLRTELSASERATFIDLLAIAHNNIPDGIIPPFKKDYIATLLNISLALLNRTIKKCVELGYFQYDDKNRLMVVMWEKYI